MVRAEDAKARCESSAVWVSRNMRPSGVLIVEGEV